MIINYYLSTIEISSSHKQLSNQLIGKEKVY